jgi:ketosteroid isomerase-like protein
VEALALNRWLVAYRRAWEQADAEAAASLFSDDARYRSHPFRPVHEGRAGVREYWTRVTSGQVDVDVRWGGPLIEGSRVAVEWWATMGSTDGREMTLAGVLVLRFDDDGLCSELREAWDEAEGRTPPPEGWGEVDVDAGEDGAAHVHRWAEGYERAWRAADAEAAAALYADDVIYRSHPFREPHRGRDEVLAYTRENFGVERSQEPRFGKPVARGSSAGIEYWVPMVEEGREVTLVGSVMLRFDPDGLAAESREYWFMEPGLHEPFEGWGR